MQARFCFLCDELHAEENPLFADRGLLGPSPLVYKLIALWRPEPDIIGRVVNRLFSRFVKIVIAPKMSTRLYNSRCDVKETSSLIPRNSAFRDRYHLKCLDYQ